MSSYHSVIHFGFLKTPAIKRNLESYIFPPWYTYHLDSKHEPDKSHSSWAPLNKQGSRKYIKDTSERKTFCVSALGKGNPLLLSQSGKIILDPVVLRGADNMGSFPWWYQKISFNLETPE